MAPWKQIGVAGWAGWTAAIIAAASEWVVTGSLPVAWSPIVQLGLGFMVLAFAGLAGSEYEQRVNLAGDS